MGAGRFDITPFISTTYNDSKNFSILSTDLLDILPIYIIMGETVQQHERKENVSD
jgi:hypothetical protein